jgi:hypothetical protein
MDLFQVKHGADIETVKYLSLESPSIKSFHVT